MRKTIILLSFFIGFSAAAQPVSYMTASIPDSLLMNAHAVVRYFDAHYTIVAPDEYILDEKYAVTVLDEKGKHFGEFSEYYSKLNSIESISGTLYDKDGMEIRSIKKKDVADLAQFDNDIADDDRVKKHSFRTQSYPYTTVYEVRVKYNSTFFIKDWHPVSGEHCSVEYAQLRVEYPKAFPVRYLPVKLPGQPVVNRCADGNTLSISVSGLKVVNESDGYTSINDQQLPCLMLAADTFSFFDNSGSMATWKDMGRFLYQLNKGRDVLTPDVKAAVHQLADTCKSNFGKINVLYKYLQKNTRYVSIQLGIGGWQTFDAAFVCEKKYGDCKALSNFMMAMLKEAGITSYVASVNAGRVESVPLNESFPCYSFNHIILCVPQKEDTTWLECTSSNLPAGYLSNYTSGRKVLLLTPAGGAVVKTPSYGVESNRLLRKATLTLNDKDELVGKVTQEFNGIYWKDEFSEVINESKSNVDKHLNSALGFANYRITGSQVTDLSQSGVASLTEELQVIATTEATRSGNSLILSTGVFPFMSAITSRTDTLNTVFQIYASHIIVDTVIINLGADYVVNTPFKEITAEYPFGTYTLKYALINKRTLIKTSTYKILAGVYPSDQFKNYKKLRNESGGQSRNKVILVKS